MLCARTGMMAGALALVPLDAAREAALVLETDKSDKRRICLRGFWRPGDLFETRCGRRTCPACGPRRARETARMLYLDAAIEPPSHTVTVTTLDPDTTAAQVAQGGKSVWLALRRRYGRADYFGRVEFTTGEAPKSGGYRRLHVHYAVKGLDGADDAEATELVRSAWGSQNVGAWRVEVARLRTRAGLVHYLALHHAKAEQLPPAAWVGRTERVSRGYWSAPGLREEARRQLWAEGLAYSTGLTAEDARLLVDGEAGNRAERSAIMAQARELGRWQPSVLPTLEGEPERVEQLAFVGDSDIPW